MKKIFFVLTVLITAFLTSCQVDVLENLNSGNGMNEKGFSLSYHVDGAFSGLTKSLVSIEKGEDQINSLYILFFENTSGGTGLFVDAVEIKSKGSAPLRSSGRVDILFPEGSDLTNTEDYKLILCANIEDYSNFNDIDALRNYCRQQKLTEGEAVHLLLNISGVEYEGDPVKEQTDNRNSMSMSNIPMSASLVKKAGDTTLTVELIRIVSRFDVSCEAAGYELVSASIWNAMTSTTLVSSIFNNYSAERTERYYGVSAINNKIVGSLYAFENYVRNPVQNDKRTTCLIIGLRKDGKSNVEYFRTNMNEIQNYGHQIKRNNAYRVAIKNVSNRGESTERGAYENPDNFIYYLELNPNFVPTVSWKGGPSEEIFVETNGNWTATIDINAGNAGFNGNVDVKTVSGRNGDSFIVTFDELTTKNVIPCARITVKLDGKEVQETIDVYQESAPTGIIVWTNTFGVSTLARSNEDPRAAEDKSTHRDNHYHYVYDLGLNMRNRNLFGANTHVYVPGGFQFIQGGVLPNWVDDADIFQFVSTPNSSEIARTKNKLAVDDKKFMIFSHTDAAVENTLSNFGMGSGYTVSFYTAATSKTDFVFIKDGDELKKPLVEYLISEGPFTKDRTIDINNIRLYSNEKAARGLTKWPKTFTPLIIHTGTGRCVFGVDVTQRFVWISDPGIFGSNVSSHKNYGNYTDTNWDNQALLNNFIAWLAYAVQEGESFTNQFRTGVN